MAIALHYAAKSDLGLGSKSRNEDSGYAGPHLLVLADGMGGHAAGDVASSMIVGELAPLDGEGVSGEHAMRVLGETVKRANSHLHHAMADNPDLAGMGSTTIAILRCGNKLAMAHIGDSRGYLVRGGEVSQITKDHSFVQQLIDDGRITEDEAMGHPQRSIVTRVMTGEPSDEPDLSLREAKVGDRYLLCSDGLSDYVTTEVIGEILQEAPTPEAACERLVEVALKASTRDNVTVVVADVVDAEGPRLPSTAPIIVGAAARRMAGEQPRPAAMSPAAKAAALSRTASGAPPEEPDNLELADETPERRKGLWVRRAILAAVVLALLVGGCIAGYKWTQQQRFVTALDGRVAVYQGVTQNLGPVSLSKPLSVTDIKTDDLPADMKASLENGIPVDKPNQADEKVASLRQKAEWCASTYGSGTNCGGRTTPTPTGGATGGPSGAPTPTPSPSGGTSKAPQPNGSASSQHQNAAENDTKAAESKPVPQLSTGTFLDRFTMKVPAVQVPRLPSGTPTP